MRVPQAFLEGEREPDEGLWMGYRFRDAGACWAGLPAAGGQGRPVKGSLSFPTCHPPCVAALGI